MIMRYRDKYTDEQIKEIRGQLYGLAEIAIDLFETNPKLRAKALKAAKGKKLSKRVKEKIKEMGLTKISIPAQKQTQENSE